jgi:hypothetical protein
MLPTEKLGRAVLCLAIAAPLALVADGCGGSEPSAPLPPIKQGGTPLKPGKYTTPRFRPKTTFKVGDGWATTSPELPDYFDIARSNAFRGIAFERIGTVAVPKDPTSLTRTSAPKDLAGWIRRHPRLRAGRPGKATVAGLPATRIDAEVRSVPKTKFPSSCGRPCVALFIPSDRRPVTYERGDMLRFLFLTAGHQRITITIAAPSDQFGSFLPQAQKVLSTVKFAAK